MVSRREPLLYTFTTGAQDQLVGVAPSDRGPAKALCAGSVTDPRWLDDHRIAHLIGCCTAAW